MNAKQHIVLCGETEKGREQKKRIGMNVQSLTMIANWAHQRKHRTEWLQFRYKIVEGHVTVPTP